MVNIGASSYIAGGVAFLILTVLLVTSWRGRLQGGLVVAASALSTAWCFFLAYQALAANAYSIAAFTLETLRGGAWLTLLLSLLGAYGKGRSLLRPLTLFVHALWLTVLLYGLVVAFAPAIIHPENPYSVIGLLAIALAGLVMVEQLYRNTNAEKRWAIKFLCLGLGGIFAYDLFLYSQSLLFRQIDAHLWDARGLVNALAVPLIAVAAARNPEWSVGIFVSRHVVFYTASLVGAGCYLLAMAAGGYYIRLYGGSWGGVAQTVFLVGAALVLLVIMLSGEARARVRVFLTKHFYKNKYDYREEWLRLIATLATPSDELTLPERTIKAIAQIVASPAGALWLRGESGQFDPAARWHLPVADATVEPADSSFARFLQDRQWVIDLGDHRRDPALYGNLVLPEWLGSIERAWLLIPLLNERQLLGFMVLTRSETFGQLTWEDTDLLKTVGQQVASYLAQHQVAEQLAEAKQFDAYNRLTAFMMHDLKNLIAQQSLVVANAARHKDNPAFIDDAIRTIDNSVRRMNQLLEQLRRGKSEGDTVRVELAELLSSTVARHASAEPVPQLEIIENGIQVQAEPQGLTMVVSHLIRNAQEATPASGRVHVRLKRTGDHAIVEVADNGCGMEPAFVRERLFRPFDSTKGSKGMGIGAYQAREFIRNAGGDISVESQSGRGTTFRISLPVLQQRTSEQGLQQAGSGK
jgi:putative PEP-CTERM system histidine kinase